MRLEKENCPGEKYRKPCTLCVCEEGVFVRKKKTETGGAIGSDTPGGMPPTLLNWRENGSLRGQETCLPEGGRCAKLLVNIGTRVPGTGQSVGREKKETGKGMGGYCSSP